MGAGLIAAGDLARRKPFGRVAAIAKSDAFPATLTGAGLIALFASLYGAYVLYDLLAPGVTFFALALVSLLAVYLSFFHGPLIAVLGFVGAYGVPFLVRTDSTGPEMLFGYLALVSLGAILVSRLRYWWWVPTLALVASVVWTLTWAITNFRVEADLTLMSFWLFLGALYVGVIANAPPPNEEPKETKKRRLKNSNLVQGLAGSITAAVFIILLFVSMIIRLRPLELSVSFF